MERPIIQKHQAKVRYHTEVLEDEVNIDMILIPGGSFRMGTEEDEIERLVQEYDEEDYRSEGPQHEVNISSFFLGRYPITQAQWKVVAGWEQVERELEADPSNFKEDYKGIDRWKRPVEQISWEEAKEFCARLSKRANKEYRLPTEAEWEYACRAGKNTAFNFGETIATELANYRGVDWETEDKVYPGNYGRGGKGIYREETTPVGYFKVANAHKLSDLHGNVWEWCEDDWHDDYIDAPRDGSAWISDKDHTLKVLRGGSWCNLPFNCRSANRTYYDRDDCCNCIGFRVVYIDANRCF